MPALIVADTAISSHIPSTHCRPPPNRHASSRILADHARKGVPRPQHQSLQQLRITRPRTHRPGHAADPSGPGLQDAHPGDGLAVPMGPRRREPLGLSPDAPGAGAEHGRRHAGRALGHLVVPFR